MAKRGSSGLSLVVGVDKPCGVSSHDVVNRARRVFGERRVGHTGTLDPLASGALLVCVGPAARLDAYLVGHDKTYEVRVVFGMATETDDAEGRVCKTAPVPSELYREDVAMARTAELVGRIKQLPPVYSAIKVNGQKAYAAARKGNILDLKPREVEIYAARFLRMGETDAAPVRELDAADDDSAEGRIPGGLLFWDLEVTVSKGTYVRSIARDLGARLGTCAHVGALRRTASGALSVEDCVSLEALEELGAKAALDPVRLLGFRFVYARGSLADDVACGRPLRADAVQVCERVRQSTAELEMCACSAGVVPSCDPLTDGEIVSVIKDNALAALYSYDAAAGVLKPACVFSTGVTRGLSA